MVGQLPNPPMMLGKPRVSKNHVAGALQLERKHAASRKRGVHLHAQ